MEQAINLGKNAFATVWNFVVDRWKKGDVFDETKADLIKESPWYQLGGIYYVSWMVVLFTGVLLIAVYLPTTALAYNSVDLLSENILGSILRGMHKYAGDAMIIAATLRVYRMWFNAEYKNKGEFAFLLSILILVIAMYSGLSGYLLIWNQRAFWATKVFATFPTYLDMVPKAWYWPWESGLDGLIVNKNTWFLPNLIGMGTKIVGDWTHQGMTTSQILLGGSSIGQATLTRFFSLHFALSLVMLVATELYFYKNRLKRINLGKGGVWLILAMILLSAIVFPAESGSRSNPEVTPLPILSDWYFLAMYQMLKYMDPYWATIWTLGVPFLTIGLTFLDVGPERDPWKRPIFTCIGIMGAVHFLAFSMLIIANQANIDQDPPYWYGSMFLTLTIGMFWHWAQYKQKNVLMSYMVMTFVIAAFYLFFWHWQAGPWLSVWYNTVVLGNAAFTVPDAQGLYSGLTVLTNYHGIEANYNEIRPVEGFNWTNLYWNFIWLGYAVVQGMIAFFLILQHDKKEGAV